MNKEEPQSNAAGGASALAAVLGAWLPIETAPANTWILTFADWDGVRPIGISLFKDVERVVEKVESECQNRKGRRRVLQEETIIEREWKGDHWSPTHWMPLPEAPNAN